MRKITLLSKFVLEGKNPYLFAVAVVAIAVGLRWLLQPILHSAAMLVLPTVAVTISAFYGGLGPGLLATSLSIAFTWLVFTQQEIAYRQPVADTITALIVFLITGLLMSILGELLLRGQKYSKSLVQQIQRRNSE